ncbi:Lrp/AsnC family transcriptional regulator [Salibacterium qingdaonense]|uniref:Lrp/AsnC family transcriptional regulator n=1 Tax=Salibacterium qingdaonense TaxID=266892 RepID=UPI000B836C02|nr:Lrp/AsnC family transcriptional regulator [Salibacterium qingdaonense]
MVDRTDHHIVNELSQNSRMTMKELGEKVHLTGQAASDRVAKLEENGVIEGYSVKVNDAKMGYPVHVFLHIIIHTAHKPYLSFIQTQDPYIINNYRISGDGCYLLECKFPSHEHVDTFLESLQEHANYKLSIVVSK